ncbi:sigma 54-interacting transcriptional regulator [Tissierella carlieri]|uniref:Sigma 54-interacting transcriptional regulator n=1 Tax=Tissierella carlieri TaxID=689904 RepID=A0ABT1SH78_9FIRM|nr:sigma 54-interacting transcriptional regulator [Tissierella carlieri]MBU5310902.1 sigma 54-interacting transcriptional regulator [Tissierella carlieri]MCQ4925849.1 sigma 54-interacting transcriptional regulator [Tissierella carlieri]
MFEQYDSKNVVIVNNKGEIIYFTMNNLPVYDLMLENTMGRKLTSLYKNLDNNNSSMIAAIKTGKSFINLKQGLKTQRDNLIYQVGSTYPLIEDGRIIGAIEFADIVNEDNTSICNRLYKHEICYKENGTCYTIDDIITQNPRMLEIKEKIRRVSKTESTVLIQGNTGTGKELVAHSIHNCSSRRYGPFISQNCGAIPENLLEGILFGTAKGSFTSAEDKEGLFELAKGGTLFLDEINSLSPVSQVKLLKAIEEKRIRRIGGTQEIPLDIRIVVALNESPEKLVKEGRMRNDLYYRLSVVQIILPDLIARKDDIELLSNYYIERYNQELDYNVKPISEELLSAFEEYHWPGNIRELRNIIEGSFNTIIRNEITIKDVPRRIFESKNISAIKVLESSGYDLKSYLENHEKDIILEAYKTHQNNLSLTAKSLKISKQLLKYKIDKYIK